MSIRTKIRARMPRTVLNVNQTSPKFIVVLAVLGIVFFYFFTWTLSFFFDIGNYNVPIQEAFLLLTMGFAVVFPFYLLDRPPHFTFWEVAMVLFVFVFNIFLLAVIAPMVMPTIFATPASVLKTGVMSLLSIP